jgi:transcriptional regulator with XRE-family HTH domain
VEREQTPFGRLARQIREARGYTVAQVARRAGLAEGTVSGIETGARGHRSSRDTVLRLATGLRATDDERDELLRRAGWPVETDLPPAPDFEQAVNSDRKLRADQKSVLLSLYQTYVRY